MKQPHIIPARIRAALLLALSVGYAMASIWSHCETTGTSYSCDSSNNTCTATADTCNFCPDSGITGCFGGGGTCTKTSGNGTYVPTPGGKCVGTTCTAITWGTPTTLTTVCT